MTIENLRSLQQVCTPAQAWELFDSLPAVRAEDLKGRWRGRELTTGHPMDGLLEVTGWYGKQFDGPDSVHPLLFSLQEGEIFAVDPRRVPIGLAGKISPSTIAKARGALGVLKALRTRRYCARLRDVEHRGVVTAAMIYDHLPILDVFRQVEPDTLLGVMDLRDVPEPYFFILARD